MKANKAAAGGGANHKNTYKKKTMLILAAATAVIFLCTLIFCGCEANTNGDVRLLRIHIRADSNDADAQSVKLKVRDTLSEYLTDELIEMTDFDDAIARTGERLQNIEALADGVLRASGYDYGARAEIKREYFPARTYNGYVVDSGTYDALIVKLGSGKGDNWWCVVYPPLCYAQQGGGDIRYKSLINELIRKYFG